jgi:tetratricopeptide (TPR) repeat protein
MKGDDENSRILLNRLDLFGKIKNYIEDFDRLFAEIESPFSDVDKTLSMLGDILLPLEDERLSAVVGRINALLEELSEDFSSIEQLRSLILQLRQELEELVWIIKGESFEGMRTLIDDGSRDLEFRGGWSVEDSEWPQPYKRLIVKIEEAQGKEGLREVFRRLSDLTEKHPLSFERYVISARAHLKEGLYTEAEKELACVKPENRSDAEYLLTVALMHEAKSELLQAETLLRDLERRHDSRMIRLRLAWVLWRRFKEEGNSSRLAEALANAKLAKRGVSDESLGLQIQTAFIYYQIVTEEGCDDLNAQNIEEGTTEVRRLLELAGRDNRLQHYRPTLEKLLDRLSDSLNMDVD